MGCYHSEMLQQSRGSLSSIDTHPDALREQVRLLREAEPHQRIAAACSLTQEMRTLSMRAVANSVPDATEPQQRAAWATLVYGDELVRNLGIGSTRR